MSDNLKLWNAVEKTPEAHTKAITGKAYQGTSPKPHYLVHKATETFGPCGIGWGFTVLDERIEDGAAGERMSIARVRVWYIWDGKRGEVEHVGGTQFSGTRASGKAFTDEDAPKKSVTDALVKALSLIGFAGDIFMGRYDDSKYVQELKDEAKAAAAPAPKRASAVPTNPPLPEGMESKTSTGSKLVADALIIALKKAQTPDDLKAWWGEKKTQENLLSLSAADLARVKEAKAVRWAELTDGVPA